jgi:glucosamine-6-phosphate deaminase
VDVIISQDKFTLGAEAAKVGGQAIKDAIAARGEATIVVATGASQFEMLEELVKMGGIDWSCVDAFHLDEYIGVADTHPASFRRYLNERFVSKLPQLRSFVFIDGTAESIDGEIERLNLLLQDRPVDVCFAGIGENSHLAFNDPPANFDVEEPYLRVQLNDACKTQQFAEGWFPTVQDVPQEAISISVKQIMKSAVLILSVPGPRKTQAATAVVEGPITNMVPASITQQHTKCSIFLDLESAAGLKQHAA